MSRPGHVVRLAAFQVLILAFVKVNGDWFQVLDTETDQGKTTLWLDVIEEPLTYDWDTQLEVCYHVYPD